MPIVTLSEETNLAPSQIVDAFNRVIRALNNNAVIYTTQVANIACTMRQFRAALTFYGELLTVENAISADANNPVNNQWFHGTGVAVGDDVWVFTQTTTAWTSAQMNLLLLNALTQPQ